MKKQLSTYFFLIVVFVSPAFVFFQPKAAADAEENRSVAQMPKKFSIRFSREFDAYYEDHFPFRKELIKRFYKFKKSIRDNPKVIFGESGYLFYNSSPFNLYAKQDNSVGDFTGKSLLDQQGYERLIEALKSQKAFYAELGIKVVFIIPPNKMTVYPEFMPKAYRDVRASFNRYDQTKQAMKEVGIDFVDLRPAFWNYATKQDLYLKTDTHWTSMGAFVAANEIFKAVGMAPLVAESAPAAAQPCGDIQRMTGLKEACTDINVVPVIRRGKHPAPECSPDRAVTVCTGHDPKALKKAFVVRDSFSTLLLPYLAERFKRVYAVWPVNFRPEDKVRSILEEKPDYLFYIYGERDLQRITTYQQK